MNRPSRDQSLAIFGSGDTSIGFSLPGAVMS